MFIKWNTFENMCKNWVLVLVFKYVDCFYSTPARVYRIYLILSLIWPTLSSSLMSSFSTLILQWQKCCGSCVEPSGVGPCGNMLRRSDSERHSALPLTFLPPEMPSPSSRVGCPCWTAPTWAWTCRYVGFAEMLLLRDSCVYLSFSLGNMDCVSSMVIGRAVVGNLGPGINSS